MEVRPADLVSEPLSPGSSVTFYWSIRPPDAGVYHGTIWLHLRFVDKSSGEESRKAVSAQIVEIEAVNSWVYLEIWREPPGSLVRLWGRSLVFHS